MSFFKDVRTMNRQAREINKGWDPGAQLRAANERMRALNDGMTNATAALSAPPGDVIHATAHVISVREAAGTLNLDVILPVDLLVFDDDQPPRSMSTTIVVPVVQLHRVQPGAALPVRLSRAAPSALAVDWNSAS